MANSETDLNLKFGADASGAVAGADTTKVAVKSVTTGVLEAASSFKELGVVAVDTLRETAVSAKEAAVEIKEVGEAVKKFREAFTGLGEVMMGAFAIEGIMKFGEKIAESAEQAVHMAQTFGLSVTQVQELGSEAALTGVPIEALGKAMTRLDASFAAAKAGGAKQGEAFRAMGVDVNGSYTQIQLLRAAEEGIAAMPPGIAKFQAAYAVFGRNVETLAPLLNITKDQLAENAAITEEYGVKSEGAAAAGFALAESMNVNKVANMGLGNVMAGAFAPVLKVVVDGMNQLAKGFIESYNSGGVAKSVMDGIVLTIKVLVEICAFCGEVFDATFRSIDAVVWVFQGIMTAVVDAVVGAVHLLIDNLKTMGTIIKDVFTLNWGAIEGDWLSGAARLGSDIVTAAKKMGTDAAAGYEAGVKDWKVATDNVAGFADFTDKLFGPDGKKAKMPSEGAGTTADTPGGKPKKEKGVPDDTMTDLQTAFEKEQAGHSDMLNNMQADEIAYWQKIKEHAANYGLTAHEIAALDLKLSKDVRAVEIQDIKQSMADKKSAADAEIATIRDALSTKVQADNEALKSVETSEKEGLTSHKAAHADVLALVADRKAAEIDAAVSVYNATIQAEDFIIAHSAVGTAERIAAAKAEQAAWEALERARVAATNQATATINSTDAAAAAERLKAWTASTDKIVGGWGTGIRGMINGSESFAQFGLNMWSGVLDNAVGSIEKMVSKWVLGEGIKLGAASASDAARVGSHAAADATISAMDFMSTLKIVTNAAIKAAANAYAAMAGIPIIGPALGAIAAGVTFVAVEAFGAMASASGGYDVPSGVNPLTQLHAEEMVLPATLANPMRTMLSTNGNGLSSSGAAGGGPGAGGGTVNLTIQAIDSQSIESLMRGPKGAAFAKGLIALRRQGVGGNIA